MSAERRTIIVGLDGVPYRLLKDLAGRGVMPNTAKLIKDGLFRQIESTVPEVSSVAWSSIITGKGPAEHGIFGFIDMPPDTYRLSFPNFNNLKSAPFWKKDMHRSVIINVPGTFPAGEMNGVHISGFVSPDLERSVYPRFILPKLKEMEYQVDVDSEKAHVSMELFLRNLEKTLKARRGAYRYLWQSEDWRIFMLVFTGTDRLMHFLWDAYEDEAHRYHSDFIRHFGQIDVIIGEMLSGLRDDDLFVMISDHGFERLEKNVNVNFALREKGLLAINGKERRHFTEIDERTKAFSLDPARIYVNKAGKYPRGGVRNSDVEKVKDEIVDILRSLEIDGRKVCRRICRREEIYSGPYMEDAPDLVLIGNEGFNLNSSLEADTLYGNNIFTGKHAQDNAFMLVRDRADSELSSRDLSVVDMLDVINKVK